MELSSLTEQDIEIDTNRLNLYYDKYSYRASLELKGIHYFRLINTVERMNAHLDTKIFTSIADLHPSTGITSTIKSVLDKMGDDLRKNIELFVLWRQQVKKLGDEFKLRIQFNRIDVYSNSLSIIDSLVSKLKAQVTCVTPLAAYDRAVIYHKNPKHNVRVYFNNKSLDGDSVAKFKNLLSSYEFKCSYSLKRSLNRELPTWAYMPMHQYAGQDKLFLHSEHYVDFDDESLITILALHNAEVVRKVCRIEKK